ncbi:MAG: tetratricopeptide repeat protein [Promethearchaeota archaeon]
MFNPNIQNKNAQSMQRCPKCTAPIPNIGPVRQHILNCTICRQVYIPTNEGIIPIEKFLDPNGILELGNVEGFSRAFQKLYTRDLKFARSGIENFKKRGIGVDNLHAFEPWEKLMKQKLAQDDLEEAMFCALQGMKDYSWSNIFWGTLIVFFSKICYQEAALRSCSMLKKLVQPPYPVNQLCQMSNEIGPAIRQIYPGYTQDQKNAVILSYYAMYSLNNQRMDRGKKKIDRAMNIDSKNYEVYRQLGSYYWMLEDHDKAIKSVEKSIQINPNNPRTKEFLNQILRDQASQKKKKTFRFRF